MRSEKARMLDQFKLTVAVSEDSGDEFLAVISGLRASMQAFGELRTYFAELSEVAPAGIQTGIEIVAASKTVSDPLAALSEGLMSGLTSSGQLSTVDSFARNSCGEGT